MGVLNSVNAMRANIEQANLLVAQLTPLHEAYKVSEMDIAHLDRTKKYFGINEDGTATILSFNPTNAAPQFDTALLLKEPEAVVGSSETAIVPLAIGVPVEEEEVPAHEPCCVCGEHLCICPVSIAE